VSLSQTDRCLAKTVRCLSQTASSAGRRVSAALLRTLYGGRHAAKRIAADCGVSPSTAKAWLAMGAPDARLLRLARRLRGQLDQRMAELAAAEAELAALERAWREGG
jgi:hypothetical protein